MLFGIHNNNRNIKADVTIFDDTFKFCYVCVFQTCNANEYQSGGHADKQGHSETDGADEAWGEAAKITN